MLGSWQAYLCMIPLYIFVLQLGQWSFVGRGLELIRPIALTVSHP